MNNISKQSAIRLGIMAVYLNLFGILFSGLIFPVLTTLFYPQPLWINAEVFIKAFHPIQTATFYCGYFLVIGSLLSFIALYFITDKRNRIWALSALLINVVFTAVVFLNYIIQTTYVPYLAINNPPEAQFVLAAFTMSNPGSLAWAFEMYGWGGIGLSFVFMAYAFSTSRFGPTLKILFLVNGICSMGSAITTSVDMNWLFSTAGFTALIAWNILVFMIDIYLLKYFRAQQILRPV